MLGISPIRPEIARALRRSGFLRSPASLSSRDAGDGYGFSLHAGIAAKASQRDKLEHLARYVSRPPVATERLSLTEGGHVRCALKTPYRDGTVFAPASPDRSRVVPGTRAAAANKAKGCGEPSASDRQRAMTWAQRLKRVFATFGSIT